MKKGRADALPFLCVVKKACKGLLNGVTDHGVYQIGDPHARS